MTVMWEFEGTIIDSAYEEISVSATRKDSESTDPPVVVELDRVSVRTNTHKMRVLDAISNKAQAELQRRITDATFQTEVDALEIQAKNNLEASDN